MNGGKKNKITKDTVPEGFTVAMAAVDLIPVIFYGLSCIRIGLLFHSTLFIVGSLISLISGIVKVIWKFIAAVSKKNVWLLFVQMRVLMPLGLILSIVGLIVDRAKYTVRAVFDAVIGLPACVFFGVGVVGMVLMTVLAFKADSSNPKVNWAEQAINNVAQICFFVGLLSV